MCTERHAARVFLNAYGNVLRFNGSTGWLRWDGKRWTRSLDGAQRGLLLETVGEYFRGEALRFSREGADAKIIGAVLKFAARCESAAGVDAILRLA
ncbi:MAG: hypothetical protein WC655_27355, partial [Candidatus Hydrogenedentales bacterium]